MSPINVFLSFLIGCPNCWTGFSSGTWDWNMGLEHGTGTWDWNMELEHGTGTWNWNIWDWNMGLEHMGLERVTGTWDWTKDARYTLLLISNSIISMGKFPTEQSKVS